MYRGIHALKNHHGFIRYFKNTSWLIIEKVFRMAVGLLVGIWVARYLGPVEFGHLSYAQSYVGLFTAFAAMGLDNVVIREIVKDSERRDVVLGTAFILRILGAMFVITLVGILTNYTSSDSGLNIFIFIIASAVFFQSFNVIDMYFQSVVLSKYVVFANIIMLILSSLIKISLILTQAPLLFFAWAILFDAIVLAIGLIYFYRFNKMYFKDWSFDIVVANELIRECWPFLFSAFVVSIYMKIDQVMIKEMLDLNAVGQYAAAVKLSGIWYFIPMVVASSYFPAIINSKKRDMNLYRSRIQKLYDFMVWSAIIIALPVTMVSEYIVTFLFGESYEQASEVLKIHIWSGVFVFLLVASGKWLVSEGLGKEALYRNVIAMLINVVLNYLFIPSFGIVGAAYATLISYAVSAFLYDLIRPRVRENFYMKLKAFFIIFRLIKNLK